MDRNVWIGLVCVTPLADCEILDASKGAFVNAVALAAHAVEYRAKVTAAMADYRLHVDEISNVCLFDDTPESRISDEVATIALELRDSGNPRHVRLSTFHTFPRVM